MIVVIRDGEPVTVTVNAGLRRRTSRRAGDRPSHGVSFGYEAARARARRASGASFAVDRMWDVTSQTVGIVARIFNAEERKQISGVVGALRGDPAESFAVRHPPGARACSPLISLSLAVINLFPFLPLDGGHIFWALVEKVRGRPVSRCGSWSGPSVVGFALVLMLFAIGLTNDIGRLTGDGFNVTLRIRFS